MNKHSYIWLVAPIFLFSCNKKPANKDPEVKLAEPTPVSIAIIPFHEIKPEQVNLVSDELESFYGVETEILPMGTMPDSCKKPYPKRYNANKILDYLYVIRPKKNNYILALTTAGIATVKGNYKEWGILGLGHRPGPCCVISTANMGKEGKRKTDRLIKVSLHEMGHNFGLPHCGSGDKRCLMRDANGTVKTVDEEEKYLCKICSGVLKSKGFNLKEFS